MSRQWVKVYSTHLVHHSEIVRGVLEDKDIKTFLINKLDSMHTHLSHGEIELFVEQKDVIKAKHLISKFEL